MTQPSQVFTKYGAYVAPEKRRADNTVYRGCYVLDIRKVLEFYCLKIHIPPKALLHDVCGSHTPLHDKYIFIFSKLSMA